MEPLKVIEIEKGITIALGKDKAVDTITKGMNKEEVLLTMFQALNQICLRIQKTHLCGNFNCPIRLAADLYQSFLESEEFKELIKLNG